MLKLSDQISRKFTEVIAISDWEVYTDTGWEEVTSFNTTIEYDVYLLELECGKVLRCADNHIVFDTNFNEVFVKDLSAGDKIIIESEDNFDYGIVKSVTLENKKEQMFDLTVNSNNSRYYTNGILSHNTTVVAAYLIWFSHFHETKQCAVLANKADQAQEIMERVQQSYEALPLFLKPGVRVYNKRSVTFWNKAKIFSGASSKSSVRGRSISLLYWDEAAFTPNDNEFYESIYPTISSGKQTKLILTSTPNGKRGVFYKIWSSPDNGFAKIKAIWSDNPTRDEEWKETTIKATSQEQFAQEFCCEFRGSQNSLISSSTMVDLFHINPVRKNDSGFKVYKPVQPNNIYFITCDVSRGIGGDYHAFTVIDITKKNEYEVAATFKNNTLSPLIYPTLIHNVAQEYNNAFVLIELNDIGEQVANILYYDLEYENILMTVSENGRQKIGFNSDSKPGVRTTTQVKSIGCSNLKTLVEKKKLTLNDENIIDELANFIPKGKSFEADSGATDDLVMSLVLFSWATTQQYFMDMVDIDLRKQLLQDRSSFSSEELTPFGIIENDFGEYTGNLEDSSFSSWNVLD